MKRLVFIFFILCSLHSKATIHQIQVWDGYMQFLPSSNVTVQLGDTVEWIPLDPPTTFHTITSSNIPNGAASFDQAWQLPADTFFQYIPQVAGLYQYVCTPHIQMGMIGEFTVVNPACQVTTIDSINNSIACVGDTLIIYGNNLCVPMSVNLQGWTIPSSLVLSSTSSQVVWILPSTSFPISGVNLRYIDSLNASSYTNIIGLSVGVEGCTDITANNYDPSANCDDGSCLYSNCIDPSLIDSTVMCAFLWAPVCGCDSVTYSNDCIAVNYAGVTSFTQGTCGSCGVEINGDSIMCNWGGAQVLTAVPTGNGIAPYTYSWSNGQSNSSILTINTPGTYCVTLTDANGCTATECINVSVQDISIYSAPSPPVICLGDSIVLEIDTLGLSNITWVPNTLVTPPVHRIVDFPLPPSQTYVVEAIDSLGCDRRGEIFVTVDSCGTTNFACMGGINPGVNTCVGPGNYVLGQTYIMAVYPTMAACIADSCSIMPPPPSPCTVEINNGTVDIEICDGDTALLEATTGFDTYLWTLSSTGAVLGTTHIIEAIDPGLYIVIVTDSTNCVDMDSIEVIVYPTTPLNPMTFPNPPDVCVGDSVVIEVAQGFLNYWWNTGNPLDQGEDRVVVYPTQDFTYVVEALDSNGCESREEIEVFVDTCATSFSETDRNKIKIYPNPASEEFFIDLNSLDFYNVEIVDVVGRLMIRRENVNNLITIKTSTFSEGMYFIRARTDSETQTYRIVIER